MLLDGDRIAVLAALFIADRLNGNIPVDEPVSVRLLPQLLPSGGPVFGHIRQAPLQHCRMHDCSI